MKHFTAGQINALIAPRPHLGMAGIYDPLTPPVGLDRIDREVTAAYADAGHFETADMRVQTLAWLDRWR